jgi:hypothetical protein
MKQIINFTVFILVVIIIGIMIYYNQTRDYIPAKATIDSFTYSNGKYEYLFKYKAKDGTTIDSYKTLNGYAFVVGRKIMILYNPKNPKYFIYFGVNLFWVTVIFLILILGRYVLITYIPEINTVSYLFLFTSAFYLLPASELRIFNPITLLQQSPLLAIPYIVGLGSAYWMLVRKEFVQRI